MSHDALRSAELPRWLQRDILEEPPLAAWRASWAPRLSYGRHNGPVSPSSRRAAVAILLCRDQGQWLIPLTVRSDQLARHRGQVSFPGGIIDDPETTRQAAAREVAEELGQAPPIDWLGELSELHVFASDARVAPCVGALDHDPAWIANPAEVSQVLRLEATELVRCRPQSMLIRRGPLEFTAPYIGVEGRQVWGSTAILLGELRGRLERLASRRRDD